ncbi:MAG TPA: PD-(D/E)XK nuclease-like domain-containing protein [Verrucomicrobiae bacterium]|nr:PD-(D/E)XK nuclease-like domain-containing protein [Verrucomicrobiae bacterium]
MSAQPQTSQRIPAIDYHAAPGLSNSALADLAVSPLRFWHLHVNPNRPGEESTPYLQFGSALHTAVLEPDEFEKRYACKLDPTLYPNLLDTMDDLKAWLTEHGMQTSAKRKRELVDRVHAKDPDVPILELLKEAHDAKHEGKIQFTVEDWMRIGGAAHSLRSEPKVAEILTNGDAEVSCFVTDPETGVPLKARFDWVTPKCTLDLKTFSQQRSKTIDKTIADAIWYERYYIQAYFYSLVRAISSGDTTAAGPQKAPEFIMAFVESEEPHEVRIRSFRPKVAGEINLFWQRARIEVHELIRLYADCLDRFGDKPWRDPRDVDPLEDHELPALLAS